MLGFNKVRGMLGMVGKSGLDIAKETGIPVETIHSFEQGGACLTSREHRALESAIVEAAVAMVRDPKAGILSGKLILLRR